MKFGKWATAVVVGLMASVLAVPVGTAAAAPAAGAIPAGGKGTATARAVQVRSLSQAPTVGPDHVALGQNGKPVSEALPVAASHGSKPTAAPMVRSATGPNAGSGLRPLTPPSTVNANFAGVDQNAGGGAQPSDVNAASGATQIVETVNRRFSVFSKTGVLQCTNTLNGFLGAPENVFDPRVQYDAPNNRFSMVITLSPTSGTAAPALYVAASQTGNACGGWWIFRVTFNGGLYPAGTLLDYPQLGQDQSALLLSSNNFHPNFINSAAFAIPKAAAYSGAGFSFSSFQVAFTTQPATVVGAAANSYFLASVGGTGYQLYRMTNSAGPGTSLVLQATVSSPFSPPPRRVNQPGTTVTLDPLDGRIAWSPYQVGGFIWFTHGINIGGFPGIRYGAISLSANTPFVAQAFRSGTSDDFNPSIGVADAGGGGNRVWLNWAYTDTPAGVATSVTVDGVLPGGGVPNLIGTGLVLVNGAVTTTNTRFGDYSSVSVENACTAVVAQQYFVAGGNWTTRLGRLSFC